MSAKVRGYPNPVRPPRGVVAPLPLARRPSRGRHLGVWHRVRIIVGVRVRIDGKADGAAHEDADVSARRPSGGQEKEQGEEGRHHPRTSPAIPSGTHARPQHTTCVEVTEAGCGGRESNPASSGEGQASTRTTVRKERQQASIVPAGHHLQVVGVEGARPGRRCDLRLGRRVAQRDGALGDAVLRPRGRNRCETTVKPTTRMARMSRTARPTNLRTRGSVTPYQSGLLVVANAGLCGHAVRAGRRRVSSVRGHGRDTRPWAGRPGRPIVGAPSRRAESPPW